MARETHADDIRNVREGDEVEITTTEGETFEATCTKRQHEQAAPESGEVRETTMWFFDAVEYQPVVSILDGLRSSPDDPEFPQHSEMWDRQQQGAIGYIETVSIFGEVSR